jgi:chemotaxis signal transduction protein
MATVLSIERADFLQLNPGDDGPEGWLLGRSQETPVFSLAARLGGTRKQQYSHTNRIILFKNRNAPWGLLVDSVSRLVESTVSDLLPLPEITTEACNGLFRCAVKTEGRLMLFLDADRINEDATSGSEGGSELQNPYESVVATGISPQPVSAGRAPAIRRDGLSKTKTGPGKVLLFSNGGVAANGRPVLFALSVKQILQISDPIPVTPVPSSPRHVEGVFNWRNHAVPLVQVDVCLGNLPEVSDTRNRILVSRAPISGEPVGFRVRPGVRVEALPLECKPQSPNGNSSYSMVTAVFDADDHTLVVPDLDAMVTPSGRQRAKVGTPYLPTARSLAVG